MNTKVNNGGGVHHTRAAGDHLSLVKQGREAIT